jgi:alanyl-tRNA synthetase
MEAKEIRKKFLEFFKERNHAIIPSSSLIPDDPSVLLTTAGMQQFKPYYTGEADAMKDFGTQNTASVQKSFRTSDIDEVGDESHLTFFEMLGNFSFGGYWKKEAIAFAHDFITKDMGLAISYVSVFKGSIVVPKDTESKEIWNELGISDVHEEGMDDVFWGPTGSSGPCGPTTEIYCKNADGKNIEVWNIVFNEFFCSGSREQLLTGNANLKPLPMKGIDTGMGLERLAMIAQKTKAIFDTDLLAPLVSLLPSELDERKCRVIADHARGIAFLLADGVRPSNKGAGYILRRLMRRVMAYEKIDNVPSHVIDAMIHEVIHEYGEFYPELSKHAEAIQKEVRDERERFGKTLGQGMKEANKFSEIDASIALDFTKRSVFPMRSLKSSAGIKLPIFLEKSLTTNSKSTKKSRARELKKNSAGMDLFWTPES